MGTDTIDQIAKAAIVPGAVARAILQPAIPVVASGRGALASAGILQPHDFAPVPEITLPSGAGFFCHRQFPIFDQIRC